MNHKILIVSELNEKSTQKVEKLQKKQKFDLIFALICDGTSTVDHFCFREESSLNNCQGLGTSGVFKSGHLSFAYFVPGANASIFNRMPVDVFLSVEWPSGLLTGSSLGQHMNVPGSHQITELVSMLKPRYHFACSPTFFEREMYSDHSEPNRLTRFIGLARFGSKEKYLYAFHLKPFDENEKPSTGLHITPFPFSRKRLASPVHDSNFFWTDDGAKKKVVASDIPPEGYLCKLCKVPGHYVYKCPDNKRELPEGYLCRICGLEGHHIKDCPHGQTNSFKQLSKCWFCLSNPDVEAHMILAVGENCYTAIAKGSLVDHHFLIIPVHHHISSRSLEVLNDGGAMFRLVEAEIDDTITKIKQYQMDHGNYLVRFEVFQGGDPNHSSVRLHHMHVNVIPVPADLISKVGAEFRKQAEEEGLLETSELPVNEFWPFIRVKVNDEPEMVFSPPLPQKGIPIVPFNLTMARYVICQVLKMEDRVDWKQCVKEFAQEEALTVELRALYPSICSTE